MSTAWMKWLLVSVALMPWAAQAAGGNDVNRMFDPRAYEQTVTRDEREILINPAGAVCVGGFTTKQYGNPALACFVAYESALRRGVYGEALHYASTGCRNYGNPSDCRRVGSLPLVLGNQGIAVPANFATEVKSVAEFVCFSGARIRHAGGRDVTAAQCGYLARQFRLSKDPDYAFALEPAARRYFEASEDLGFAGKLHLAACERHGHADSCVDARRLGLAVDEKAALLARRNGNADDPGKPGPLQKRVRDL